MGFKTITPPTVEPLTIEECRLHLRTDEDLTTETALDEAEDAEIMKFLSAAREFAEGVTGLYLAVRTVEQTFDRWPCRGMQLQAAPLRVVESIEYLAQEDGAAIELDPGVYEVNDYRTPVRIELGFEQEWPDARCASNSIKVRTVVGYGTIADSPPDVLALPADIRSALLLVMAHLYENREDSTALVLERIPNGALTLLGLKRENLGV